MPFLGKGSTTESTYDIVVEMEKGQLFKVENCTEKSLDYKLKRVAKHFPGKLCTIRKRVVIVYHYETEKFVLDRPLSAIANEYTREELQETANRLWEKSGRKNPMSVGALLESKELKMCGHCNGFGSSLKDPIGVDRCTVCGGSGLEK